MKAVTIHEYGGPEELIYEDVPMPHFGPDEILVPVSREVRVRGQHA